MDFILTADDDPIFSELLKEFLESKGYLVRQVDNGTDACLKAQEWQPCLLILDMQMPGIYGGSAYKTLLGNPATKNIPAIFITGVDLDIMKKAVAPGPNVKVMSKPVDFTLLERYLSEILGNQPTAPGP